jgi:hypothetical protein
MNSHGCPNSFDCERAAGRASGCGPRRPTSSPGSVGMINRGMIKFVRFLSQNMSYDDAVEVFRRNGADLHERDYIDLVRRHRGSTTAMRRINAAWHVIKNVVRNRTDREPAPEPSGVMDDGELSQRPRPNQDRGRWAPGPARHDIGEQSERLRAEETSGTSRNCAHGDLRLRTRRTGVPRSASGAPPCRPP